MTVIFSLTAEHKFPANEAEAHIPSQFCLCQPKLRTNRNENWSVRGYLWIHHAWHPGAI